MCLVCLVVVVWGLKVPVMYCLWHAVPCCALIPTYLRRDYYDDPAHAGELQGIDKEKYVAGGLLCCWHTALNVVKRVEAFLMMLHVEALLCATRAGCCTLVLQMSIVGVGVV